MIISARNINLPYSGIYKERIYDDNEILHFGMQEWCFVEFTNEDASLWCGHFRGVFQDLTISQTNDFLLILTSAYFYKLDKNTGDLMAWAENPMYHCLAFTPDENILISDGYNLEKLMNNLEEIISIESPIPMENIVFKGWEGSVLKFECDEFLNWDNHLEMAYDHSTHQIFIIKSSQNSGVEKISAEKRQTFLQKIFSLIIKFVNQTFNKP